MRPLRDIKRLVRHAEIGSRAEANHAVLDDLLRQLAGRTDAPVPAGRHTRRTMAASPLARVVAAAAIITIVALAVVSRTSHGPSSSGTSSPADMLTVGRLNAACRRGGLTEIERQCEQAAQRLQSRPERISTEQLIREMEGT